MIKLDFILYVAIGKRYSCVIIKNEGVNVQYKKIEFGSDQTKITITLLEESMGKGLIGMVSSPLFRENIALVVSEEDETDGYTFAGLGYGKNNVAPRVLMTTELYNGLMAGCTMAKTAVMHEVGHYYNEDKGSDGNDCEEIRRKLVIQNKVCIKEIKADAFAVKYLGKNVAVAGLNALKDKILTEYMGCEEESVLLSVRELEIRISKINEE